MGSRGLLYYSPLKKAKQKNPFMSHIEAKRYQLIQCVVTKP